MKFDVQKSVLVDVLSRANKIAQPKNILECFRCILIDVSITDVKIIASDISHLITSEMNAIVHSTGRCVVNAANLMAFIRHFKPMEFISFELLGDKLKVYVGNDNLMLGCYDLEDYYEKMCNNKEFSVKVGVIGRGELNAALNFVRHSIAKGDHRYYLNGVFFELGEQFALVSSDGHRLSKVVINGDIFERCNFIVDEYIISTLLDKSKVGVVEIYKDEDHVKFCWDGVSVVTKLIDGKFPDYNRVIPNNIEWSIGVEGKALLGALQLVKGTTLSTIGLSCGGGYLNLVGDDFCSKIAVTCDDVMDAIFFNPKYLYDAVKAHSGTGRIDLNFPQERGSVVIRPGNILGDEQKLCIVMAMRV